MRASAAQPLCTRPGRAISIPLPQVRAHDAETAPEGPRLRARRPGGRAALADRGPWGESAAEIVGGEPRAPGGHLHVRTGPPWTASTSTSSSTSSSASTSRPRRARPSPACSGARDVASRLPRARFAVVARFDPGLDETVPADCLLARTHTRVGVDRVAVVARFDPGLDNSCASSSATASSSTSKSRSARTAPPSRSASPTSSFAAPARPSTSTAPLSTVATACAATARSAASSPRARTPGGSSCSRSATSPTSRASCRDSAADLNHRGTRSQARGSRRRGAPPGAPENVIPDAPEGAVYDLLISIAGHPGGMIVDVPVRVLLPFAQVESGKNTRKRLVEARIIEEHRLSIHREIVRRLQHEADGLLGTTSKAPGARRAALESKPSHTLKEIVPSCRGRREIWDLLFFVMIVFPYLADRAESYHFEP